MQKGFGFKFLLSSAKDSMWQVILKILAWNTVVRDHSDRDAPVVWFGITRASICSNWGCFFKMVFSTHSFKKTNKNENTLHSFSISNTCKSLGNTNVYWNVWRCWLSYSLIGRQSLISFNCRWFVVFYWYFMFLVDFIMLVYFYPVVSRLECSYYCGKTGYH